MKVNRVFRYIAGTIYYGIVYDSKIKPEMECFSTGRSTTGIVIKYSGGAVSWTSQRQSMVATSTTEAGIVAASEAAKQIIWLNRLYSEITKMEDIPMLLLNHRRTKLISLRQKIVVKQISTSEQLADIMTKPLH